MLARRTVLFACAFAALTQPARAATPLTDRSTTVFTVAGGGTQPPRDGGVATRARMDIADIAAFAHGGALLQTFDGEEDDRGPLWRLDPSGVLKAVPGLPATSEVTSLPDGSVAYAVVEPAKGSKRGTQIVRVDPAGVVSPVADLRTALPEILYLVAQADGSLLAADQENVYRVAPDGAVTPVEPEPALEGGIYDLLAQPDGSYLARGYHDAFVRVVPGRGQARAKARLGDKTPFSALTDGTLLAASGEGELQGDIALVDPTGRGATRTLVGETPGPGDGDGGLAATMRMTLRGAVSTPEQGLLAIDEGIGAENADYLDSRGLGAGSRLRLLSPFGTTPAAAVAITPATFASRTAGGVSFLTGQRGALTLSALRPHTDHVLATATGPAPGGLGELAFARPLAPGRYDLRLDFTGADGSRGAAYAHLETTRALSLTRARKIVVDRHQDTSGEGSYTGVGRCARLGARAVTCPVEEVSFGRRGHSQVLGRRCEFRETVRLEIDGVHVSDERC